LAMIGLGMAWASIVTIPYAILAGTLPKDKMGLYMGLLNITVCLPQIIAALTMGAVVSFFFHNHVMPAIMIAGVFFIIAAILTFFIHDIKVE
jgi:maltose/moltooligosaccharide transporter